MFDRICVCVCFCHRHGTRNWLILRNITWWNVKLHTINAKVLVCFTWPVKIWPKWEIWKMKLLPKLDQEIGSMNMNMRIWMKLEATLVSKVVMGKLNYYWKVWKSCMLKQHLIWIIDTTLAISLKWLKMMHTKWDVPLLNSPTMAIEWHCWLVIMPFQISKIGPFMKKVQQHLHAKAEQILTILDYAVSMKSTINHIFDRISKNIIDSQIILPVFSINLIFCFVLHFKSDSVPC